MSANYPLLFSPFSFAGLTLRNRIVLPPMTTDFATVDGFVTQRLIDYYEARAAGGAGMIIVEMACIDPPIGRGEYAQLSIDKDEFVPGLAEVPPAIKRQGAVAFLQIHHAGRRAYVAPGGSDPVGPSAIAAPIPGYRVPRALAIGEIETLIERFASGAERAQRAGFDGIELHAAHGYLISQFLSPLSNQRTDDYGGPLTNRARFLLEVVHEVKRRVGKFPVGVRLAAEEFAPGGLTLDEAKAIAQWLQAAGVDVIHVSSATASGSPFPPPTAPACFPNGCYLPLAAGIKSSVDVPVIGVGRIKSADLAESALREGQCDLVAIGRSQIADPEFANKVAAGREDDVTPCISCNTCVHVTVNEDQPLVCAVNAAAGRERAYEITQAPTKKKVVVVGAGPAGLEAARVAASRGHEVHVFESQALNGGQLRLASVPPHKGELGDFASYLSRSIQALGVSVHSGQPADAETVLALRPDAVVLAAGATPLNLKLPRGDSGPQVALAHDVLAGQVPVGGRMVVIGGGMVGSETAEWLALSDGSEVTVVELLDGVALDMIPMLRSLLLKRLAEAKVQILTKTRAQAIVESGLLVSLGDGTERVLPADWIILAAGARPNNGLRTELEGRVPELHVVGDAAKPRRILEAIHDGAAAGFAL